MTEPDLFADLTPFRLFTSSYRVFQPEWGVPVQISNGRPKYPLPYALQFKVTMLYPEWRLVQDKTLRVAQFRQAYWAGLDKVGVANITDVLIEVALAAGDDRLVLMCFEKRRSDCHRGDFATWWTRNTFQPVEELP